MWILIQQNKGMRTKVLNFPTVPVSFEAVEKKQLNKNNIRMVGEKYPYSTVVCMRMRFSKRIFVCFLFHVIFASLTYIIHFEHDRKVYDFSTLRYMFFCLRIMHLVSSSHIKSLNADPEKSMGKFFFHKNNRTQS